VSVKTKYLSVDTAYKSIIVNSTERFSDVLVGAVQILLLRRS